MKETIVLVDVDETIVETNDAWKHWARIYTNTYLDFDKFITDEKLIAFWRQKDLYDHLLPRPEAVAVLKFLDSSPGLEIHFASHCYDEHIESKKKFLKDWFPFYKSFTNASTYKEIYAQYVIDDRPNLHLKVRIANPDATTILVKTDYMMDMDLRNTDYLMTWKQIKQFFTNDKF